MYVLAVSAVAFVPARGGSKRLPGKNRLELGGRTLVERAVDSALDSGKFDRVVLSTDDDMIAGRLEPRDGVEVVRRPQEHAGDSATVLGACLNFLESSPLTDDWVGILLPTCPFRTAQHVRGGFDLISEDVDAVISVVEFDFPWEMALIDEHGFGYPAVDPSPLITGNTRSQDRRRVFHPNGAFYLGRVSSVIRDRTFFAGKMRLFEMNATSSWDIDEQLDLEMASWLVERGYER